MKRILLHVGTHKTGSTTIQETLFRNRERLMEQGIHYLSIGANHWDIYSAFMDAPWEWHENHRRGLNKEQVLELNERTLRVVSEEIESSPCEWVIISAEHLSMLRPKNIDALKKWLASLGQIQVVYFVRGIEAWIASDSQQCAKVGIRGRPTPYKVAIQRLFDFPLAWREVFGESHFTLLRFEDAAAKGCTNALLSVAGLPELSHLGVQEQELNVSISAEAVECFYQLNRVAPRGTDRCNQKLVKMLKEMPGGKYSAPDLTKEQVKDHNRKMEHLKKRYQINLYSPLSYPGEGCDEASFSEDSTRYLVKKLNNTLNRLDKLEREHDSIQYLMSNLHDTRNRLEKLERNQSNFDS